MKILMLAPTPFFAHRGCHVRILEEVRSLVSRGHEVVLVTYGLGDDVPGIRVERSLRVPWYRKLSAGPSWHKLYLDLLLAARAIRVARRFRPDVIHAHLHEGAFLAQVVSRLAGRPPILADFQGSLTTEMADHGFFSGWPWGERVFAHLEDRIHRGPDEIVVSSREAMPPIERSRRGRPGHTVHFLADGVDAETFRPDPRAGREIRDRLGVAPAAKVVGFLGLLTEYQGVDHLLEAAGEVLRQHADTVFLVMGFPNESFYRSRAEDLGLGGRVVFPGRIPYEQAAAHLAACDVAVSPKLSLTEANGKLLNYMAAGLPTVVFESGINRALLGDAGVFARYGDSEDLARCLSDLLGDPERRRAIGARLRRRAIEEFAWESRARQLEEIYERLTGS